jgi:hypothetical protein
MMYSLDSYLCTFFLTPGWYWFQEQTSNILAEELGFALAS